MYIEQTVSGYVGTEQVTRRGRFLLLLQTDATGSAVYACVRRVALHQCGHWMMGRANIGGRWVTVSGAYGNDGLTLTVPALPSDAVQLPAELRDAWNNGGGWNSAGAEGPALRDWALKAPMSSADGSHCSGRNGD